MTDKTCVNSPRGVMTNQNGFNFPKGAKQEFCAKYSRGQRRIKTDSTPLGELWRIRTWVNSPRGAMSDQNLCQLP